MVRIEEATMVWSSAARNMPIISPLRMVMICLWLRSGSSSWARVAWAVDSAMSVLLVGGSVGRREDRGRCRATVPEVLVE